MRSIINISLPKPMLKEVQSAVKAGNFASTSEFFRHLLREWKSARLAKELHKMTKDFEKGRGKVLKSFSDLM